jgi:hypothetical protein
VAAVTFGSLAVSTGADEAGDGAWDLLHPPLIAENPRTATMQPTAMQMSCFGVII